MKSFILAIIVLVILLGGLTVLHHFLNEKPKVDSGLSSEYAGPVPEGYDEAYYRKTGITKPLENG